MCPSKKPPQALAWLQSSESLVSRPYTLPDALLSLLVMPGCAHRNIPFTDKCDGDAYDFCL